MNIEQIKEFMDSFETCVISTVDVDQPQAATVGFSVDDDFKLLVATNQSTRKAKNLRQNPKVAITIGFEGAKTLQLEGRAEKVDKELMSERVELHLNKVPAAKRFAGDVGQEYYLIVPLWLRFSDFTANTPVFETRSFR